VLVVGVSGAEVLCWGRGEVGCRCAAEVMGRRAAEVPGGGDAAVPCGMALCPQCATGRGDPSWSAAWASADEEQRRPRLVPPSRGNASRQRARAIGPAGV